MAVASKIETVVEIWYSGAWHEVPVYTRDVIRITRKSGSNGFKPVPATVSLSIKNDATGTYSPRQPMSPLYGLVGRNTPLRITTEGSVRFYGEIQAWPQRWNLKGNDRWAPITAHGLLYRLNAPGRTAPARSALRRAYTSTGGVLNLGIYAYWAMEEGPDATSAASSIAGVNALNFTSAAVPAGVDRTQVGTSAFPLVADGARMFEAPTTFTLPASAAGFMACGFVIEGTIPRPTTAKAVQYNVMDIAFGSGGITRALVVAYAKWTGTAFDTTNVGMDVILTGGTSFGSVIGGAGTFNLFDGDCHDVQVRLRQSGADVVGELWIDGILADDATSAAKTLGAPSTFVPPVGSTGALGGTTVDNTESTLGIGHLAFSSNSSIPKPHDAATGHVGELATDRIERLLTEDDIPITVTGTTSSAMGVQRIASVLSLVQDAVDVDGGMLYESRTSLGLEFRGIADLYNQTATVSLNYALTDEIGPGLEGVEDTNAIENDVTVTRYQGGFSRYEQATGPLNTQEPTVSPTGAGRYEKDYILVLATDTQCASHASWKVHVGTNDDARYSSILMDLSAMRGAGKTALVTAAAAADMGDMVSIANPPAWLPPETIEQLVNDFTETIESHHWTIEVGGTPARPYEVWTVASGANRGRIPPAYGETTVNEVLDTTETGVDIISTTVRWIDSATYATMFPFDIMINGERMTVTALTGVGLTQTMTVTRSVNGQVKTHAAGSVVELFKTPVIGQG
jgi:hypothetical protein